MNREDKSRIRVLLVDDHPLVREGVHGGGLFFKPEIAEAFFKEYVLNGGKLENSIPRQLSKREHQVLTSVVDGMANKEIAHRLELSVRTVEKHRQRIMKKLGIHK